MKTKGQAAMEHLMTYGWAILVVMVVGIVMWQLGIFNMGSIPTTASGFTKLKPQLASAGMKDNVFTGVFTNMAGGFITIMDGNATLDNGNGCTLTVEPAQIISGDNFKLTSGTCTTDGNPGDVYKMTITIPYTVSIGSITTTQADIGIIRGPLE